MSWLLFLDESGHDHKSMPYEVRGGVAIHASQLWSFVGQLQALEQDSYGLTLSEFQSEIKGSKLLDKDRFKWANQATALDPETRRKLCRVFMTKGLEKKSHKRDEFTAYGQASLEMARGIFKLLLVHRAVLFAAAIPKGVLKPEGYARSDHLRKDQVFLLERFFYFLEHKREQGILVMDQVDKDSDRRFVKTLQSYFRDTEIGRYRTQWIVPTPFFVSSDMAYPVQVADLCIYALNWGYRVPGIGMNAPTRPEIEGEFASYIRSLRFDGDGYRDGVSFKTYGVVFVPDPYTAR